LIWLIKIVNIHQGPPDQVRRAQISVTNTEEKPLNFKIRTTGPKFYTIQPNGVRIDPGQTNTFTISLYPGKYCLTSHKFSITVSSIEGLTAEISKVYKFQSLIKDEQPIGPAGDFKLSQCRTSESVERSSEISRINFVYCILIFVVGVLVGPLLKDFVSA